MTAPLPTELDPEPEDLVALVASMTATELARAAAAELELVEVWCERCPAAAVRIVVGSAGRHSLCDPHAIELDYKLHASSWNGGLGRQKGVRP